MPRHVSAGVRIICVVLSLALWNFAHPSGAGAQSLTLRKVACGTSSSGVQESVCGFQVNARTGDMVRYEISYTYAGPVGGTVTITDQLQAGQAYVESTCAIPPTTPPSTCTVTGNTVTITLYNAGNGSGTVSFATQITAGSGYTIYNVAGGTAPGTSTYSDTTAVTVVPGAPTPGPGPGPGPGPLTSGLTKEVADISAGTGYGTTISAISGQTLNYSLDLTNLTGSPMSGAVISDPIQAGQTLLPGTCTGAPCSVVGNSVVFNVGALPAGQTIDVSFDVTLTSAPNYGVIYNTATANGAGFSYTSNTTSVTVGGAYYPQQYNPYPANYCYDYLYYCYYPTYNYPVYSTAPLTGTTTICGVVTQYTPVGIGNGLLVINGETFVLTQYATLTGLPITVGTPFCFTFTFNSYGRIDALQVLPNVAGVSYVCGALGQFLPGFNPYPGFDPYQGYNPYAPYAPYAGYGIYPAPGSPGMYGWGGPMFIGGYPYSLAPNTYFPYYMTYGNNYCFLLSSQGQVSGSLSVVPTLATPATQQETPYRLGRGWAI